MEIPVLPEDILYLLAECTNKTMLVSKFFYRYWMDATLSIMSDAKKLETMDENAIKKIKILTVTNLRGQNFTYLPIVGTPNYDKLIMLLNNVNYLSISLDLLGNTRVTLDNTRIMDLQGQYVNRIKQNMYEHIELRNFKLYMHGNNFGENYRKYMSSGDISMIEKYKKYLGIYCYRQWADSIDFVHTVRFTELHFVLRVSDVMFHDENVKHLKIINTNPDRKMLDILLTFKNLETVIFIGDINGKKKRVLQNTIPFMEFIPYAMQKPV